MEPMTYDLYVGPSPDGSMIHPVSMRESTTLWTKPRRMPKRSPGGD
jgi:hypothetical protein